MPSCTEVSSPHGVKRPGDDSLDSEQRLAKRFNLLNLDREGKLYIPISAKQPAKSPQSSQTPNEFMQLDDTKDKIYIYDLDAELAESEQSEPDKERLVFIPDIERHLTKVPKHILTGQEEEVKKDNQLVLYQVPAALSVPEDKDSVRKAVIEARARARQKQENSYQGPASNNVPGMEQKAQPIFTGAHVPSGIVDEDDGDIMDIG
ncbi:hypothetical protein EV356DRAFT_532795 [Viridothelium virens]|uniref:Uncharacterized protein n=1 Tax=Viridothelium virens TaxID=1048519 RepID=A0A6A6H8S0_VIRVR|nr:hypothetical protein EV356DRAFT_532795 [Viridothelium virens]